LSPVKKSASEHENASNEKNSEGLNQNDVNKVKDCLKKRKKEGQTK
jgi:hypothetical protein